MSCHVTCVYMLKAAGPRHPTGLELCVACILYPRCHLVPSGTIQVLIKLVTVAVFPESSWPGISHLVGLPIQNLDRNELAPLLGGGWSMPWTSLRLGGDRIETVVGPLLFGASSGVRWGRHRPWVNTRSRARRTEDLRIETSHGRRVE